jgi:tRNA (pseudouridine54-N1)-methyltransferase
MKTFIIQVNHELVPFELNGMTSIRMDLVARCVNSALWLDHDLRRDTIVYFCFKNNKVVKIDGHIRGMNPDERNVGSFFRYLLEGRKFPGIELSEESFIGVVEKFKDSDVYVMDINGKPMNVVKFRENPVFILGDDIGVTEKVKGEKITLGPKSYLTSHCIVIIQNYFDRVELWP